MSNDLTLPPQSMPARKGLLSRMGWIRHTSPEAREIRNRIVLDRIEKQHHKAVTAISNTLLALPDGEDDARRRSRQIDIPVGHDRLKPGFSPGRRQPKPQSPMPTPLATALKTALTDLLAAYNKWPDRKHPAKTQASLTIQNGLVTLARHLEVQTKASHLQDADCTAAVIRAISALERVIEADNRRHARGSLVSFERSLRAFEGQPSLRDFGR